MRNPGDLGTRPGHLLRASTQTEERLYDDDLGRGAQVGSYVVEELRARGGFATVYRARHVAIGRVAALKVLHRNLAASTSAIKRFQQEARAVNLIRHPNIVDIYELGELTDGRPYFVMEWLEGDDLEAVVRQHGPMSAQEALAVIEDLGAALAAAHALGIVHRDLKASNVLLCPAGGWYHVKLVDFGVAKLIKDDAASDADLTATGLRVGTPWNMAPEQIRGRVVDARTDIYALGILFYQLVTGRLPFVADSAAEVEEMHLHAPPPRASHFCPVSPAVDEVIVHCLEKDPEARPASVEMVLHELRRALHDGSTTRTTTVARALAVHVEAGVKLGEGLSEDALDDLDATLESVRAWFDQNALRPAVESAHVLVGVQSLPTDETEARARDSLLEHLLALRRQLVGREGKHPSVHFRISVNVGTVALRREGTRVEFVGGELISLGYWSARGPESMITAAAEALSGFEQKFLLQPVDGQAGFFTVLDRTEAVQPVS